MSALEWQVEAHRATERFLLVCAGRRIGKSIFGGREAYCQSLIPDSRIWVVAPNLDLAEKEFRVVWDLAVTRQTIPIRRKSERELFIAFDNGSFIECRTEENPDQLIGEGLDLVIMAEAARMKLRTWHQYVRPTLSDRRGRAIFTSTPRGFNWFYDFFMRGQDTGIGGDKDEYPDWRSWKLPSMANPLLDEDEIEEMRKSLSPEAFRQEVLADFIAYGGLVFSEFDYNVHVRAHAYDNTSSMRTALWIDPGITNPYCVLLVQITPDETIRVLDEIYLSGRVSDQIIDLAEAKWPYALLSNGQPRTDVDVVIDEAAAEAVASWRLRGYRAGGTGGKPGVAAGIEVHHRMLRDPFVTLPPTDENPLGIVPRITFDPRAKNAIREHNLYHYPDEARKRVESNLTELPVAADDHAIAAIRYGYAATFPELFNQVRPSDEMVYLSGDEFLESLGQDPSRMRIDSGYAPPMRPEWEYSLGDYE